MFSRSYTRALAFGMLMHNAEKATGGGTSAKPLTVPELTQRVKDLEGERDAATQAKDKAEADLKTETESVTRLEGEKDVAVKAKDKAESDLKTEKETVIRLEGEKDAALKAKGEVEAAKIQVEGELTTTKTDLQDATGRLEIAAKSGAPLPPKGAGLGDHTQDKPADKTLTPTQRLASTIKIA
jgi:membrane protein involved in colicin uptake